MKIRKSSIAAAVATVAAGAMLAVSTPAYAATTLTVWADDMVAKSIKSVVAKYESANNVDVVVSIKDFGQIRDLLITATGANNAPDVVAGAHDWTGKLVAAGAVAPIALGGMKNELNANAVKAFLFNGKTYGLPFATENIAILRNKAKAASAPKTWAAMNGKIEIGFSKTGGDPYHFYPLQSSFGAPVFKSNAKGWTTTLGMGGANGAKFANWLAKQKNNLKPDLGWNDLICNLNDPSKKIAYWLTGPWATGSIASGVSGKCAGLGANGYAIDPIPSAGGKTAQQFFGARGLFVSAKSKNKIAATQFVVNFMGSAEVQYEIYKDGGRIPANKNALVLAGNDKNIAAFARAGAKAVPMPNIVAMDSVWTKWGQTEAAIVTGKSKNPAKDWAAMVTAIQKLVNKK